jgi:hypothetical protein
LIIKDKSVDKKTIETKLKVIENSARNTLSLINELKKELSSEDIKPGTISKSEGVDFNLSDLMHDLIN